MNNYIKVFKKVLSLVGFIAVLLAISTPNAEGQTQINNLNWVDFATGVLVDPLGQYVIEENIGSPANPVTQMYTGTFTGSLNGAGYRIYVNINSNNSNVGLFSQLGGGTIDFLIVDGQITGGQNSQNVGGIVGLVLGGGFRTNTNLADVTGLASTSSVGGIAGAINSTYMVHNCTNNGTITGCQYVGGITGRTITIYVTIDWSRNAGTIQGNNIRRGEGDSAIAPPESATYIGGIVGYFEGKHHTQLASLVNIGMILSRYFTYAGGIAGCITDGALNLCINAGIVDGATYCVGGIAGYLGDSMYIYSCINTNWVDSGTALHFGAIAGLCNAIYLNSYYDNQMCAISAIDNQDIPNSAEGRPTALMIGSNLPIVYNIHPQLYPMANYNNLHPIDLLAAAPIYLQNNERVDYVTQNFYVSNFNNNPLYPPLISEPYLWGWYNQNYIPFSANGFIEMQQPNNAVIRIRGGWDTLAVRLINYNYPPYSNYNIIFEKIVPINVRP